MNEVTVTWLNGLSAAEAQAVLLRCCGSTEWARRVAASRPWADGAALVEAADEALEALAEADVLEALASHPRIGDFQSLKMRYAGNREWSAGEQSGAAEADDETLRRLAAGNDAYERRFGYLFVVCATGKSAAEMLAILEARLQNVPADELRVAAGEQRKITHLRLAKLQPPAETP